MRNEKRPRIQDRVSTSPRSAAGSVTSVERLGCHVAAAPFPPRRQWLPLAPSSPGCRARGYRGPYLVRLATGVAEGSIDLEQLTDSDMPDAEVEKRLPALPGVGPYAAAHVMLVSLWAGTGS